MATFCVVYGKWNFSYFHLELNAVVGIGVLYSSKQSRIRLLNITRTTLLGVVFGVIIVTA